MAREERIAEEHFRAIQLEDASLHDVIYSVKTAEDGTVYLGACCEANRPAAARMYRYDPQDESVKLVADIEALTGDRPDSGRLPHSKIHLAICIAADGTVYAGTHLTGPPKGVPFTPWYETFGDPDLSFPGGKIIAYNPNTDQAELVGAPCPHEGIRVMTLDRARNDLYCITFPRSHLIRFDLDSRTARDLGRTSAENSMALFQDQDGRVYLTDDWGFFLRYDPDKDAIERLSARVPDAPWRTGRGNHVRRIVADPGRNVFWGVPMKSERLFSYDPADGPHGRVKDYGHFIYEDRFNRWPHLLGIKAMALGVDGRIYLGVSEEEPYLGSGTVHIVSFDPATGEKRDFGIMEEPGLPGIVYAVDADAGLDGTLYFGTRQIDPPPQLGVFSPPKDQADIEIKSELIEVDDSPPASLDKPRLWVVPEDVPREEEPVQARFNRTPFTVIRGHVDVRELGFGEQGLLIPDGESAINALVTTPQGVILGATSGKRSHLFRYNPTGQAFFTDTPNARVLQMGLIHDGPAICQSMVTTPKGIVYGGTIEKGEGKPTGGRLFSLDSRLYGDVPEALALPRRPYALGPRPDIIDLGPMPDDQGVEALAISPDGRELYGVTTPAADFFVYDIESRQFTFRERIPARQPCHAIVCDSRGKVYGSADMGWMFRYDPATEELSILDLRLPSEHGREYLAVVRSFARAPDGRIYGGTSGDGMLFSFDPIQLTIENLGRPSRRPEIQTLAVTLDGRLFGISNGPDEIGRLFVYNPTDGQIQDLGMLQCAGVPKFWPGYQFGAMTVGLDGEIYVGESDRISHLFVYYPPLLTPKAVEDEAGS